MNLLKALFTTIILFAVISCSDGINLSTEIKSVLSKENIEKVAITYICNEQANTIHLKSSVEIESQVILIGDHHYNIGAIKNYSIKGSELVLSF